MTTTTRPDRAAETTSTTDVPAHTGSRASRVLGDPRRWSAPSPSSCWAWS